MLTQSLPGNAAWSLGGATNRSHIDARNYIPVATYLPLLQDFTFPGLIPGGRRASCSDSRQLDARIGWSLSFHLESERHHPLTGQCQAQGIEAPGTVISPFGWRQYGDHCSFCHLSRLDLARNVRVFVASGLQLNATLWIEHRERNRILAGRREPPTWQLWASPGAQRISEGSQEFSLWLDLWCGTAHSNRRLQAG
jgi:hypothetical protein